MKKGKRTGLLCTGGAIILMIVTGIIILSSCKEAESTDGTVAVSSGADENVITATEFAATIQSGWCLGNTLDSITYTRSHDVTGTETAWGNVVTTKEIIQTVADAGFDAIRIPVTFYDNCDEDANIDEAWLDRVEEVVNYALDCGLYCIINVHHDTGMGAWITANAEDYETSSYRLQRLWEQIAERFQNYSYDLIFEGFNELIDSENSWGETSAENYGVTNQLNQLFVDTVRATGGNNAERLLLVNLYAASPSASNIENFVLPEDSVENRLLVGIHSYTVDEDEMETVILLVNAYFISQGIPVILGEFGTQADGNDAEARVASAKQVIQLATGFGIPYFWWDDGGTAASAEEVTNYALLDRQNLTWYFPDILEVLVNWEGPE